MANRSGDCAGRGAIVVREAESCRSRTTRVDRSMAATSARTTPARPDAERACDGDVRACSKVRRAPKQQLLEIWRHVGAVRPCGKEDSELKAPRVPDAARWFQCVATAVLVYCSWCSLTFLIGVICQPLDGTWRRGRAHVHGVPPWIHPSANSFGGLQIGPTEAPKKCTKKL